MDDRLKQRLLTSLKALVDRIAQQQGMPGTRFADDPDMREAIELQKILREMPPDHSADPNVVTFSGES
jgi:hypothetical protein